MADIRIIKAPGTSEVIEKRSRFIGQAVKVDSEEEAAAFVEAVKKKHYDARHSCWAYVIGDKGGSVRASDDGEPLGTAGRPILDVITGAGLTYTLVVVTRYFGGTLLGTGGLVRAYTAAALEAVKNAQTVTLAEGERLKISCSYSDSGKIQYLFSQNDVKVEASEYAEAVTFSVIVKKNDSGRFAGLITEAANGRAVIESEGEGLFEF